MKRTFTGPFPKTPLPNSKISLYKYSKSASPNDKSAKTPTQDFTLHVQSQPYQEHPEFCGTDPVQPTTTRGMYVVKPLFRSVPVDPALDIICGRLQQDPLLHSRTSLSIHNIITLLEFCLKSTLFTFRGKYYEQVPGAAMGSLISPLVANHFMENFEARALGTVMYGSAVWFLRLSRGIGLHIL